MKKKKKCRRLQLTIPAIKKLRDMIERGEIGKGMIDKGERCNAGSVKVKYVLKKKTMDNNDRSEKKMEEKELMIGDWLFYRGQFNAFCFRVEQINRKKVGYHAEPNECRMHYLRLSECQPVPLTEKRLELIGFGKTQHLYFLTAENKVFPGKIILEYILSNCCLYINDGLIPEPIRYVHQLQHAMHLCGIEKDIAIY